VRGLRTAFAIIIVAATLTLNPVPGDRIALGHSGDNYGWSDCHWAWREAPSWPTPNLTVRDDGTYPADGWGDGVLNSFNQRINDMVARWSTEMYRLGLRGRLVRVPSNQFANIVLRNRATGGAAGITFLDGLTGPDLSQRCPVHGTSDDRILAAEVWTDVRSDWFTQGWERRTYWEGCPARGDTTSYTCKKTADFAGAVVHELGHVYGLRHPDSVDCHINEPDCNKFRVFALANCDTGAQATMCPGYIRYHAQNWTLEAWDTESFRRQYANHMP